MGKKGFSVVGTIYWRGMTGLVHIIEDLIRSRHLERGSDWEGVAASSLPQCLYLFPSEKVAVSQAAASLTPQSRAPSPVCQPLALSSRYNEVPKQKQRAEFHSTSLLSSSSTTLLLPVSFLSREVSLPSHYCLVLHWKVEEEPTDGKRNFICQVLFYKKFTKKRCRARKKRVAIGTK